MKNKFRITVNKKRGLLGALLGIAFMVLMFTQRNVHIQSDGDMGKVYLLGVPLAVAFFLVGSLKIETTRTGWRYGLNGLWTVAVVGTTMLWSTAAVESIAIWRMDPVHLALNMAVFFLLTLIVYLFSRNWKGSVSAAAIVMGLLAAVNSVVWQFRGKELLFSDLMAVGTAMKVAGDYSAVLTLRMTIGLAMWVLLLFAQFSIPSIPKGRKLQTRCVSGIFAVIMAVAVLWGMSTMRIRTWEVEGSVMNGLYMNFLLSVKDSFVKAPEGYSETAVETLEDHYENGAASQGPNILVIMNESFVDMSVLGNALNTNEPVTPYFDSLQENTIRGYALTPALGGSTANAEFEFLTGNTMAYLPNGSNPYQQYVNEKTFSLAWLLRSFGYESTATHPMPATGWSRDKVYPLLGFEDSTFIEDYPQQKLVRSHVSDREVYEKVLQTLDQNDSKLFLFGVTMQNHGGYNYVGDNYTKTIELSGYSQEYPQTEQYLSLMQESDKALEFLLTSLAEYPEDTLVVFFGDHFPKTESEFMDEVHGGSLSTLDEKMLKRKVPFVIWANYDLPAQTVECTSLNYLGRYVLEAAGMELPAYYSFMKDMEEVIPAMNHMGYYSKQQGKFVAFDKAEGEEKAWLDKYAIMQYNGLFDKTNRSDKFFADYLPN